MSNPILIDPIAFAREGRVLERTLPVAELDQRVLDLLADTSGAYSFALTGRVDRLHRPVLDFTLKAEFVVSCQRCLESMKQPVEARASLTLFTDEGRLEEAEAADETLDAVLVEAEFDVMALVEDEIIMGLPGSPKHESCDSDHLQRARADKPNPFAVLAQLKTGKSE